jgi:alkylation response protein AidB-like acyl-CoA dehydrogenase
MTALTDEQLALRAAVARLLDKRSSPEQVRAAEPLGFDRAVWEGVVELGLIDAAASRDACFADLAVVAELWGARLAPAPFVEAVVAARLLGNTDTDGGVTTFAVRPAVAGVASLVPAGAVAAAVVALDGDRLVLARPSDRAHTADLGAMALADIALDDVELLADGAEAHTRHRQALDEWRALTAVALSGLARAALDLGVQYVKDRHQFGVPIGSFQSVQHRLADLHTAADGARLLALSAVHAIDTGAKDRGALAAMAFAGCGQVADEAAGASLHYHGGYGFMLEYDVQLYVRRAKAWRIALGDPRQQLQVVAERLWGPHATPLLRQLDPDTETFRQEIRGFIDRHLTADIIEQAHATGTMHDWGLHHAIAERGYLSAGWPVEVGGQGRSAVEMTTLMQEMYGAGAPVDGMGIAGLVAATLALCGNEQQRTEILPRILAGELMTCLGYSEPDAGSDVAAVQTRAVRDGDEWVINGQKMFTTMAHEAHYVFLLTRTDPSKPKHKGLTMFLVPMDAPGIEITPVHTLGGERTNITFYTDVRVPDSCRVGDVDAGWSVMHAALVYERNGANWGEPNHVVESVAAWAVETGAFADPVVRDRLAHHAIQMEIGRLLVYRSAALAAAGGMPLVEGSMAKLFITEAFTRAASDGLDIVGSPLPGLAEHAFRHSTVTTIYGGSSEVQRGIIAERGLGLPRTRS